MPSEILSKTKTNTRGLPEYASFLLHHHFDEFVKLTIQKTYELDIPILKYFKSLSEAEFEALAKKGAEDLLKALANRTTALYIEETVTRWEQNLLPQVARDQIVVQDISLVALLRKVVFTEFIPRFTANVTEVLQLVREIDEYILAYTSACYKTFISLLEARLEVQVNKLEESDRLFNQAQAITHIGNYVWDLKENKLTWSDELYRIYELNPRVDSINNLIVREYNHLEDQLLVATCVAKSIETLEPFDFYYRIVLKDGRIKTLHARGEIQIDVEGKASKIIGTTQDVTIQKQVEKQLVENQNFVQKITDATPSIITVYNTITGEYFFVNEALKKILGYQAQQALQEGISFFINLIHAEDLTVLMQKNQQALQEANTMLPRDGTEPIIEFQYRMRHINGEYRWFHTFGTVFSRDRKNQVEAILNISLDITERVKAEQILNQRTSELQQSNARLQEFAFIASHDLKEPLRKITIFGDRLASIHKQQGLTLGQTYLDKIINSSLRMQEMISDLLALSQIAGDKSFKRINLQKVLQETLLTLEHKIEEMNAEVIVENALPEAVISAGQFHQLFLNLLNNALKFTRVGIKPIIKIKHRILNQAPQYRELRPSEQYIELIVEDNGIGFDNLFVDKIFGVFQRLHGREQYEGTGMGLAICKKIVENHGGVIRASGKVNQGATFTIIIPG